MNPGKSGEEAEKDGENWHPRALAPRCAGVSVLPGGAAGRQPGGAGAPVFW